MDYSKLTQKQQKLAHLQPLDRALAQNLQAWFKVELTYSSNAIEGNTLSRRETATVLEKGIAIGGKKLVEHLEVINHAQALEFIYKLAQKKRDQLTLHDILDLHAIILKNIDDDNAGRYRNVAVRISGSEVVLPNPRKLADLMIHFHEWLISKHNMHPVEFAGEAHYRLVTIHPFIDGNGRTARLLMNLLLLMYNYPMAIIRPRDRVQYIEALEKAQLGGAKTSYNKIIFKAVDRSLDMYLKAIQDSD